jgi:membrane protease YdiL (CAAX protease family)
VLKELVRQPGNRMPDFSAYPLPVIGLVLACAALVGAVSEEVGLRGYLQSRFERIAPWPVAVVAMALVAAPGHALTQGFVWPTLLFYLLADVTYGVTAYLTNSILPGIIAHAAGLFVFFAFIWPHDAARPMTSLARGGAETWGPVAQASLFGALAIWAFVRLARATASLRA